jgi:peptide/nickel transport system substrate-binding protein
MRSHPIGTGPFKFVEFEPNERIVVTKNPDYWKKDRPYLDGIEYTIINDVSTRLLAFIAGKDEIYFGVTIPQLKDVEKEAPQAICQIVTANVAPKPDCQPGLAAVRQPRSAEGDVAEP